MGVELPFSASVFIGQLSGTHGEGAGYCPVGALYPLDQEGGLYPSGGKNWRGHTYAAGLIQRFGSALNLNLHFVMELVARGSDGGGLWLLIRGGYA